MITITPCTSLDSAAIAALWDHMSGIAESCWYGAASATPAMIDAHMSAGVVFVLATDGEEPLGFGLWRPIGDALRLHALAADTAEVYYHLMVAYAEWGIDQNLAAGWCEIDTRQTRERGWMDALAAVAVEPIGREPLVAGQDPELRAVEWLRVSADLAVLRQAALDELGG
jgi:hypothetical protein